MLRRVLVSVLAVLLLSVAVLWGLKARADRHYYDGYDPAPPLSAQTGEIVPVEKTITVFGQELPARYRRQTLSFEARPGETIDAVMTLPFTPDDTPAPVIVLVHGSHQGKEFVEDICTPFNESGFAMVCFDQLMSGGRRVQGGPVTIALAYRERMWKTVHDTRRLIDYLQTRPDIDPDRVYLVGASFGAITGTAVLAQEKRIKAGVLVVGGGNARLFAKAPEIRREVPGWLLPALPALLPVLIGPAEPVVHAPHTAGIPVLMQNGSKDGVITPESGEALFAALGEPKELRWYPVDHPDREPNGAEVVRMLDEGREWLLARDAEVTAK